MKTSTTVAQHIKGNVTNERQGYTWRQLLMGNCGWRQVSYSSQRLWLGRSI